ncbi:MAG: CBS domain-containing protein [Pseudomonadota bacterium]
MTGYCVRIAARSIGRDAKVAEVVATLRRQGIGALVVVNEDDGVVGIISERDVLRGLADQGAAVLDRTVDTLMTSAVITCKPEDRANAVMAMMSNRRVRHMPVVVDGKLTGIVSIGDIVKKRLDEVQMEADAMRDFIATA